VSEAVFTSVTVTVTVAIAIAITVPGHPPGAHYSREA